MRHSPHAVCLDKYPKYSPLSEHSIEKVKILHAALESYFLLPGMCRTKDDVIREGVKNAKRRYKQRHDSLDFNIVKVPGFGRADLKKAGLGPDSMMQLAIQMAHHKVHPSDSPCSVYESCSTAIFKYAHQISFGTISSCFGGF